MNNFKILKFQSIEIELGKVIYVNFGYGKPFPVRVIKVTPKGYNLLNEETNKCILKRHMYRVKDDTGNSMTVTTLSQLKLYKK